MPLPGDRVTSNDGGTYRLILVRFKIRSRTFHLSLGDVHNHRNRAVDNGLLLRYSGVLVRIAQRSG